MGRSKQTQRQLWSPQVGWGRGARRWASLIGWAVCGAVLWAAGTVAGAAWAQGVGEASGEVVRAGSPGVGAKAAYRLRAGRFLAGAGGVRGGTWGRSGSRGRRGSGGARPGAAAVSDQFRSQTVALSGVGVARPGVSLAPTGTLGLLATPVGQSSSAQTVTL